MDTFEQVLLVMRDALRVEDMSATTHNRLTWAIQALDDLRLDVRAEARKAHSATSVNDYIDISTRIIERLGRRA